MSVDAILPNVNRDKLGTYNNFRKRECLLGREMAWALALD